MSRLSDMLKRLAPALVVALLTLTAGIALGSSGLRDWVGSKPAASEVTSSPARAATHSSDRRAKYKQGKQGKHQAEDRD
jgi:hypothetical protein